MSKNFGLIVTAIVAVVAIIGLVINFSGSSATGAAQSTYVPLEGYPSNNPIDFDEYYETLGLEKGQECLSWTKDQQKCCDVLCPNEAGFSTCKLHCKDVIEEYYGY